MEQFLGRLLTDAEFRDFFFSNPNVTLSQAHTLTEDERIALAPASIGLSSEVLAEQGACLTTTIRRADLRRKGSSTSSASHGAGAFH